MKYGFVGLGHMGKPMARNLARSGLPTVVHNRTRSKAEALVPDGAMVADSPGDVAQQADVVFTCLLYPSDVEQVYFGPAGLFESGRPGQVFVDTSTVSPELTRRTASRLAERSIGFLDAPISGGVGGAEAGKLAIMVGGPDAAFAAARPALEVMGSHIFHLGPSGSGTAMKLVNQLLVAVGQVLAAEGMVFGVKAGLNPRDIYNVIRVSSGHSVAFERVMKDFVLKRNFEPAATVNLILKDLDCIAEAAGAIDVRSPLTSVARSMFAEAQALGHGERDLASIILPFEEAAGVQVGPA